MLRVKVGRQYILYCFRSPIHIQVNPINIKKCKISSGRESAKTVASGSVTEQKYTVELIHKKHDRKGKTARGQKVILRWK